MKAKTTCCSLLLLAAAIAQTASAQLTQWNFNDGTTTPSVGSGTASYVFITAPGTGAFPTGAGSSDPETATDLSWSGSAFPAQGAGSGTAGFQFNVSTVGFENVTLSFDIRGSSTASRHYQVQYSTDGTTFTPIQSFENTSNSSSAWVPTSVDLSSISAVDNNANFAFRIVSTFQPSTSAYQAIGNTATYSVNGTWRVDWLTVAATPVPEPETYAAIAGAALVGFAAWRRRARK